MKASALIIASFVVGALVTASLATVARSAGTAGATDAGATAVGAVLTEPARNMQPAPLAQRHEARHAPAQITIPKLDVTARIGNKLDDGPIWWPVTGRPGGGDTVAIAGHRTTHTHPFLDLDRLVSGDLIYVRWHGRSHRYAVSGRRILSSTNQHIADARGYEVLLLTACTPKGSARQRIVIYARPAGAVRPSTPDGRQ